MNKKILVPLLLLLAAGVFYYTRLPRFSTGTALPDFSVALSDGQTVHLSDLKGKIVLIQFWGSWCGPCRRENPYLVDLYQKYHPKGLEIISVAVERAPENWQKAIEKDGLNWPMHVMESGDFDGSLAKLFNIKQIPTLLLVNKSGVLMTTNPSMAVLGKALSEHCK